MNAQRIPRRQSIPILYTKGTHYDVGFDMGRTFSSIIKEFLELCNPLNDEYLPLYNTEDGKKVYDETLESVKGSFPQYVRELEGIAEGAKVEFHKLFLLHMDDILPHGIKNKESKAKTCTCGSTTTSIKSTPKELAGCSTIILNSKNARILGHTEDALSETLNHFYFVIAHIINDSPQGKHKVKEEHFMSLCYAGLLPGYTMNYNHHGLVFSINTLSANCLHSGRTPRVFITRALLATENYDQAVEVLKDTGVGAADGCSINMTFIKYLRLKVEEAATGVFLDSSDARMNFFENYKPPRSKEDVVEMLSNSCGDHCVFHENGSVSEEVKTIALGIFDLKAGTYEIYSDNPKTNDPLVKLPLILKCKCT